MYGRESDVRANLKVVLIELGNVVHANRIIATFLIVQYSPFFVFLKFNIYSAGSWNRKCWWNEW